MKETRNYGALFLWLSSLTIIFAIIAKNTFFKDALAYGILLAILLSLISLIIYSKARK